MSRGPQGSESSDILLDEELEAQHSQLSQSHAALCWLCVHVFIIHDWIHRLRLFSLT